MKKLFNIALCALAAFGLASCEQDHIDCVYNPDNAETPVLDGEGVTGAGVLLKENEAELVTINILSLADHKLPTSTGYTLYIDRSGNEMAAAASLASTVTTTEEACTVSVKVKDLNVALLKYVGPEKEVTVDFQLVGYMTTDKGAAIEETKLYSNIISATFTTYNAVVAPADEYKHVWVIGNYNDWDHSKCQYLYDYSKDGNTFTGTIDFGEAGALGSSSQGFKITDAPDWSNGEWGTDEEAAEATEPASVPMVPKGANIKDYAKRFYTFTFDMGGLKLTKVWGGTSIGLVGTINNWGGDGDDIEMSYNPTFGRFYVDYEFTADSEFKFRADNDKEWKSGDWGGKDGKVTGDNIKVSAGKYRVYFNMGQMTYELSTDMYGKDEPGQGGGSTTPDTPDTPDTPVDPATADWLIHGQTASTEWADVPLTKVSDDLYVALGVVVAQNDSKFVLKSGDEKTWIGVDKTAHPDGIVTVGAKMTVSSDKVDGCVAAAGTYDYWLKPKSGAAWIQTAGENINFVADAWGLVGSVNNWGNAVGTGTAKVGDFELKAEGEYFVVKGFYLTTADEFKIRFNNAWDDTKNYGLEVDGVVAINTTTSVITSGGSKNIKIDTEGMYDIYFDLANAKLYVMEQGKTPADAAAEPDAPATPEVPQTLGVTGAFSGYSWDPAAAPQLSLVDGKYRGYLQMNGEKIEFKFTQGSTWYGNGGVDGENLTLTTDGGAGNFSLTAGLYSFEVDITANTAKAVAMQSVGIIGDATTAGWDGTVDFTYDAADGLYKLNNVVLKAGKMKLRLHDTSWGYNLGGAWDNLVHNGADIAVEAGNYNLVLDLKVAPAKMTLTPAN